MSKRYDEVMEKIEMTDDMRRRILANIGKMDLAAAPRSRALRFPSAKRLMPLAACFVLLAAGVFSARYLLPGETENPIPTGGVMVGSGIEEMADAAALRRAVGFPVKELLSLPFQADETAYTSFWGNMAQIKYTGPEQTVTFRQSLGDGDNSGDYNVYAVTEVREMGGWSVTLKGDGESWALAVWSDGTYAYSISAEPGLAAPEWETVIAGME